MELGGEGRAILKTFLPTNSKKAWGVAAKPGRPETRSSDCSATSGFTGCSGAWIVIYDFLYARLLVDAAGARGVWKKPKKDKFHKRPGPDVGPWDALLNRKRIVGGGKKIIGEVEIIRLRKLCVSFPWV